MASAEDFVEFGYTFGQVGVETKIDGEPVDDEIGDYKQVESASDGPINKW
jgi:hypothetical protein